MSRVRVILNLFIEEGFGMKRILVLLSVLCSVVYGFVYRVPERKPDVYNFPPEVLEMARISNGGTIGDYHRQFGFNKDEPRLTTAQDASVFSLEGEEVDLLDLLLKDSKPGILVIGAPG